MPAVFVLAFCFNFLFFFVQHKSIQNKMMLKAMRYLPVKHFYDKSWMSMSCAKSFHCEGNKISSLLINKTCSRSFASHVRSLPMEKIRSLEDIRTTIKGFAADEFDSFHCKGIEIEKFRMFLTEDKFNNLQFNSALRFELAKFLVNNLDQCWNSTVKDLFETVTLINFLQRNDLFVKMEDNSGINSKISCDLREGTNNIL